jgi:hypothetical protein
MSATVGEGAGAGGALQAVTARLNIINAAEKSSTILRFPLLM